MSREDQLKNLKLVQHAVRTLEEHFDTVQILCTHHEASGTTRYESGSGNWYARVGQMRDFLIRDRAGVEHNEVAPPEEED